MIFKLTKSNDKQILISAESWLDLFKGLPNDVIKIERLEYDKAEMVHKRTIDADELLKRIAKKCKIPSLSKDTVNGLCGATAIIYDMLNESEG